MTSKLLRVARLQVSLCLSLHEPISNRIPVSGVFPINLCQQTEDGLEVQGDKRNISDAFGYMGSSNMIIYVRPEQMRALLAVQIAVHTVNNTTNEIGMVG